MAYKSLFDRMQKGISEKIELETKDGTEVELCFHYGHFGRYQAFEGTFEDVLISLLCSLTNSKESVKNIAAIVLQPPRIIRALIDYKVDNPKIEGLEELLRQTISLGLDIYDKGSEDKETLVCPVMDLINSINNNFFQHNFALMDYMIKQKIDSTTWRCSHPNKSQRSAYMLEKITEKYQNHDLLFITLGHGGVQAGMDVYLRYCDLTQNENSEFYVVRLSRAKKKDTKPQLTQEEITYLKSLAQGRQVVIFDEDSYSGKTLDAAYNYFSQNVFPEQDAFFVLTNLSIDDNSDNKLSRLCPANTDDNVTYFCSHGFRIKQ